MFTYKFLLQLFHTHTEYTEVTLESTLRFMCHCQFDSDEHETNTCTRHELLSNKWQIIRFWRPKGGGGGLLNFCCNIFINIFWNFDKLWTPNLGSLGRSIYYKTYLTSSKHIGPQFLDNHFLHQVYVFTQ